MSSPPNTVTVQLGCSPINTSPSTEIVYSAKVVADAALQEPLKPEKNNLVFLGAGSQLDSHTDSPHSIDRRNIFPIPPNMSPQTAYEHISALLTARAILYSKLNLPIASHELNTSNILLMGGETSLGAAAIQILHDALPCAKIMATSTNPSQSDLFQRVCHTMSLGCVYAIDGACEGMVDHLRGAVEAYGHPFEVPGAKQFDVIVNAVAGALPRRDVLELMEEDGKVVDLAAIEVDQEEVLSNLDGNQKATLESMLMEAARVFDMYQEPPMECGFSDEQ